MEDNARPVTGVFERRVDEGRLDIGRHRFHKARGHVDLDGCGEERPTGLVLGTQWAFVARRHPWRLAIVSLCDRDALSPAVTAWADDATAVLKGVPATQHVVGPNHSIGNLGLRRMLDPESLQAFVPLPWPTSFDVPGHLLDDDVFVAPELTFLAVDHYEAGFDPALGLLTAWRGFIDGEVALSLTLSQLTAVED